MERAAQPLRLDGSSLNGTKIKRIVMIRYFHTILLICLRVYYEAIQVLKH